MRRTACCEGAWVDTQAASAIGSRTAAKRKFVFNGDRLGTGTANISWVTRIFWFLVSFAVAYEARR